MHGAKRFEGESQHQLGWGSEFNPAEQSQARRRLEHLIGPQGVGHAGAQQIPKVSRTVAEVPGFEDIQGRQTRTHRQGVFAVGRGVYDRAAQRTVHRVADLVGHDYGRDWDESAAESFSEHDHIGLNVKAMRGKELARAKHSSLHFVEHKHRSVFSADRLHVAQILRRGYSDSSFSLDWLKDKRRKLSSSQLFLDARDVSEWNCLGVGKQGAESFTPESVVHQRQSATSQPVKRALAIEKGITFRGRAGELDGGLDTFATRTGKKDLL